MFFSKKIKAEDTALLATIRAKKDEIRQKLDLVNEVNEKLSAAVRETQELSVDVVKKLKTELKIAKKSLTSMCSKLKDAVILVDHSGKIIQLNRMGETIFEAKEAKVKGRTMCEVVEMINPVNNQSICAKLQPDFFINLSKKLLSRMDVCEDKHTTCNTCLSEELPQFFDMEKEIILDALVTASQTKQRFNFTFSILDNDPEQLDDLIYIFIFRPAEGVQRRRKTDVHLQDLIPQK